MSNTGVKLDDDLSAHMALHHLPSHHQTTRQVIIATAESSNVALTVNGVLSQINELIRDGESTKTTASALNTQWRSQNHSQGNFERCTNGTHNPKTAHLADQCWQLHPHKHPNANLRRGHPSTASIIGRALCATAVNGNRSGKPLLDTGTTQTMFEDRSSFAQYVPSSTLIEVANGDAIDGCGLGTVQVTHQGAL